MAFRSRPQTRFQSELLAPEREELVRRYCWLRYVQTLGIYQRSPIALLGLAQGLRGSLGVGVASHRDTLVIGGSNPLAHLYRLSPTTLTDTVAMGLLATGQADAILGEFAFQGSLLTQVELLREAVRLRLNLVAIAQPDDVRGVEAAISLGWQVEHLTGGDLFEGWRLGRALRLRFQSATVPVAVVLDDAEDNFDVEDLGSIGSSVLNRFEREVVEAASRFSDDTRPELARTAARRRLVSAIAEADVDSLGGLIRLVRSRLGPASVLVGAEVLERLTDDDVDAVVRLGEPAVLAESLSRWGGFPLVVEARTPAPSRSLYLSMTFGRDLRPGSTGIVVESLEELLFFTDRLAGELVQSTQDYLVISEHFPRDGFGRLEYAAGRWLRPQSDLSLITWGKSTPIALQACSFLDDVARRVGVLQLHQPGLVDEKLLAQAVRAERVCILYDGTPDVGYQLVAYLQEYFYSQLRAPILLRSARSGPGPVAVMLRGLL